jgi:hypothetical protein
MVKPLVPRNWNITNAVVGSKKSVSVVLRGKRSRGGGGSVFSGSKKNSKRPITLPSVDNRAASAFDDEGLF